MTLTRRTVLRGAGATLALAATAARPVWAVADLDLGGGVRVTTLSDGNLVLPRDFILGPMPEAEVAPILARHGIEGPQLTPECNVTLMRDGERVVLFDAGAGAAFQASTGRLGQALDAAGIDPGEVTHVVFTHGHPDHLWGVLDDFDEPLFYNAAHMIGRGERDYWTDPATVDSIGAARTAFAVGAARRLEAIEGVTSFFDDGEEILPGVAARLTPGHTPGHMSFQIGGGSEQVMVVGDAIGNHHVGFERPDLPSGSDQDQTLGAVTRAGLLDQIAGAQMRLIGFHLPGGGIGHAERIDGGYRYVPEGA